MKRWLKSFLVGFAAAFTGGSPQPLELTPIRREAEDIERSGADCAVRTRGSVRYTYAGSMITFAEGGTIDRTTYWKTVLDRDFRNRCVSGTGFNEFVQARTRD
jgi:hypothetical protein